MSPGRIPGRIDPVATLRRTKTPVNWEITRAIMKTETTVNKPTEVPRTIFRVFGKRVFFARSTPPQSTASGASPGAKNRLRRSDLETWEKSSFVSSTELRGRVINTCSLSQTTSLSLTRGSSSGVKRSSSLRRLDFKVSLFCGLTCKAAVGLEHDVLDRTGVNCRVEIGKTHLNNLTATRVRDSDVVTTGRYT